jgi:hypothetical protein
MPSSRNRMNHRYILERGAKLSGTIHHGQPERST